MRLAWFTDTLWDINGVARFVADASLRLCNQGRDVRLFTCSRRNHDATARVSNSAPLLALPMPGYPTLDLAFPSLRLLRREVERFNPDIIHISTPGPVGLAARSIARKLRLPIVGIHHTDFPAYLDHLFNNNSCSTLASALLARFYRPFARILARAPGSTAPLEALGIPHDRIHHLAPGIETARFGPHLRDPSLWNLLNIPAAAPKVLYVGRVSLEKNLSLLARIWTEYLRLPSAPRAELVIVGDGPYRAHMERELTGHHAHFLGFRQGIELAALYASSDLFLFPSTTDTLGQVVLEAQASALPALVSTLGGPSQIIQHRRTGLVLPPQSPRVWARAIADLLSDHPRRANMSAEALDHSKKFDFAASINDFWSAHEQTLADFTARAKP